MVEAHAGNAGLESDGLSQRLVQHLRGGFPLVERPFAQIAAAAGLNEEDLLERLQRLLAQGLLRRLGPVFQIEAAPARFVLVAAAVPGGQFDTLAAQMRTLAEVALLRRRDHHFNLWLLLAPEHARSRQDAIAHLHAMLAGFEVLVMPPAGGFGASVAHGALHRDPAPIEGPLMRALGSGLPLVPRPYEALAAMLGADAGEVQRALAQWLDEGLALRIGAVPHDARLTAAFDLITVWDVDEMHLARLAPRVAAVRGVQRVWVRARAGPTWPGNLWLALHGVSVDEVRQAEQRVSDALGDACAGHDALRALALRP